MALDKQEDSGGPDQDRTGDLCHAISQSKADLLILQGPDRLQPLFSASCSQITPQENMKDPDDPPKRIISPGAVLPEAPYSF
jgi:hypothetical protein